MQDENGFARTCWHDILMQEAARSARAAKELLCAALNDCREDFVTAQADAEASKKTPAAKEKAVAAVNEKFAEPLERLENSAALLGEVERLAGAGEWTPLYDRLTPYVLGMEQAPGLKNMKKRLTGEHKDAVKTRADEAAKLFEKIEDLISCSLDEAELDRKAAEPCLRALFAAVRDFDAALRPGSGREDCWNSAISSIWPCGSCGTPTASPPSCVRASGSYAAVMVDEYQDTNALQDALYRCLASPAGDDLFLVGDLKQSIYRFRQADPSIFREKLESWPSCPAAKPPPSRRRQARRERHAGTGCQLPLCPAGGGGHQLYLRTAHDARSGRHGLRRRTAPGLRRTRRVRGQCGGPLPARRCRRDGRKIYRRPHRGDGGFRRAGAGRRHHPPGAV